MRDLQTKVDNVDELTAPEFNSINDELENLATSADNVLDGQFGPDTNLNMLGKAVAAYANAGATYKDTGTSNNYVLNIASNLKATFKYYDNMKVTFKATNSNTGISTINVSSIGAKNLTQANGDPLSVDTIVSEEYATAVYNLTDDRFEISDVIISSADPLPAGVATPGSTGQVSDAGHIHPFLPNRNAIINGNFDIWQRGTSYSGVVNGYNTRDRWFNNCTNYSRIDSQQSFILGQSDVPNNPKFFTRSEITIATTGSSDFNALFQRIENADTFANETVALSFWAKADSTKNIAISFTRNYGTGGSPSSQETGIGTQQITLTSVWQKFSIIVDIPTVFGKVLGTNNDDSLQLDFWFGAGTTFDSRTDSLGHQAGIFDIAQVQLEKGSVSTDFERRAFGQELSLCQRYYWRLLVVAATGYATASGQTARCMTTANFPSTMRAIPEVDTTNAAFTFSGLTTGNITVMEKSITSVAFSRISSGAGSTYWFTNDAGYISLDSEL